MNYLRMRENMDDKKLRVTPAARKLAKDVFLLFEEAGYQDVQMLLGYTTANNRLENIRFGASSLLSNPTEIIG